MTRPEERSAAAEAPLLRRIEGFHQDEENHWVARLDCGHTRHVRHDPPFSVRPWVLTAEGRNERLGLELACSKCLTGDPPPQKT